MIYLTEYVGFGSMKLLDLASSQPLVGNAIRKPFGSRQAFPKGCWE